MNVKNAITSGQTPFDSAVAVVESVLPPGWDVAALREGPDGGSMTLTSQRFSPAAIEVHVVSGLSPREAARLEHKKSPELVVAPWLSDRTRDVLVRGGYGYADQTGNVHIRIANPPLSVFSEGSHRNPDAAPPIAPGLKGARAWALMRTLAEVLPPYNVSGLARAISTDAGYVSRLLKVLSEELLISRAQRGPIETTDWQGLLRQLAMTYSFASANETTRWVAAGGASQAVDDLRSLSGSDWAITGSFAACELVSVTVPEQLMVFSTDLKPLVDRCRLLPVKNGGNVVIASPYDAIALERKWLRGGLRFASPIQIALDCLSGPGRMPAEGEALVSWLRERQPDWQASDFEAVPASP